MDGERGLALNTGSDSSRSGTCVCMYVRACGCMLVVVWWCVCARARGGYLEGFKIATLLVIEACANLEAGDRDHESRIGVKVIV